MRSSQKTLLYVAGAILMVVALYNALAPSSGEPPGYVSLGRLMAVIRDEPARVKSLNISGRSWRGEWSDGSAFHTHAPRLDGALVEQLNGVPFDVLEPDDADWVTLFVGSWVPMLAVVAVFFLFMRVLQGGTKLRARVAELEAELQRLKSG